jgi:ribosome-binding factor A
MSETRARRVAEQIKKEVSRIVGKDLKDPRMGGLVSITGVQVSRDLRYAWIYVSIYGTEAEQEEAFGTLQRAVGFVRSEVGKRIRLRHVPEIIFSLDRSMEYGARIEKVIKELHSEKQEHE